MSNSKNKVLRTKLIIVCGVIAIIAIILCLLFNGRETRITKGEGIYSLKALVCENSFPDSPFFSMDGAINSKHKIKATYRQDLVNKISYTYTASFNSESAAEQANATLHAKYNNYMGQYNLNPAILGPIFSINKSDFKINLYADELNINSLTGVLLFLDSNESNKLSKSSIEDLEKIYTSKSFKCEIFNNEKEENEKN